MKLKQMMFATLFGLSMVAQFPVQPALGEIPTKGRWVEASGTMNLKDKAVKNIGDAFERYHTVIKETAKNVQKVPYDPNDPNGRAVTVLDFKARIKAASKLKCSLNVFITQLQKKKNFEYQAAIDYLVDRASDVAEEEEKFVQNQELLEERLAELRGVPNASFNEAKTVGQIESLIDKAIAKFSNIEQNPNNVGAFYSGDIRAITIALRPLKRNRPQTYTTMVDAFNAKAARIGSVIENTPDRLKVVGQAKSAIFSLQAALDELKSQRR